MQQDLTENLAALNSLPASSERPLGLFPARAPQASTATRWSTPASEPGRSGPSEPYGKYNGMEDKTEDPHYYTTWLKFGLGHASFGAS